MDNFKIGDKIICIDNDEGHSRYLTLGKIYYVISIDLHYGRLRIKDDSRDYQNYFPRRFKKVNENKEIKVYGISLFCESLKRR